MDREVKELRIAEAVISHRRHSFNVRQKQDNITSFVVDRVTRRNGYFTITAFASHGKAAADAEGMQTEIVQPAHLAIKAIKRLQVLSEKALAVEKPQTLDMWKS